MQVRTGAAATSGPRGSSLIRFDWHHKKTSYNLPCVSTPVLTQALIGVWKYVATPYFELSYA